QKKALRVACRVADAVIANAAAVATQTERELGVNADKLHVIYNGIDVDHFDAQAWRTPESLLSAAPVMLPRVVMVGSMHLSDKGHAELIEVAHILKVRGVCAQYIFVSDNKLHHDLKT